MALSREGGDALELAHGCVTSLMPSPISGASKRRALLRRGPHPLLGGSAHLGLDLANAVRPSAILAAETGDPAAARAPLAGSRGALRRSGVAEGVEECRVAWRRLRGRLFRVRSQRRDRRGRPLRDRGTRLSCAGRPAGTVGGAPGAPPERASGGRHEPPSWALARLAGHPDLVRDASLEPGPSSKGTSTVTAWSTSRSRCAIPIAEGAAF